MNLVRLPLPYDAAFMELYYKAFNLVRAFLKADALVPQEVALPDAEDRFITHELELRRDFPVLEVIEVIRDMAQPGLLETEPVENVEPTAAISADHGLEEGPPPGEDAEPISISPEPQEG